MATIEYLSFIPLLMYGIGLTDLLAQWKRLIKPEKVYWPYILFTIVLTEIGIYNVFIYFNLLLDVQGQDYLEYVIYLFPPLIYTLTVNAFIPEKGDETRVYFHKNIRTVFILAALLVISHFLFKFDEPPGTHYFRLGFTGFLLITAYFRKEWLYYLLFGVWALAFFLRETSRASFAKSLEPEIVMIHKSENLVRVK